jgi:hypothetical protein
MSLLRSNENNNIVEGGGEEKWVFDSDGFKGISSLVGLRGAIKRV